MSKEKKLTAEHNVGKFLREEDPSFSMWTASNETYPLIEWMQKMANYADHKTSSLTQELSESKKEIERLKEEIIDPAIELTEKLKSENGELFKSVLSLCSQLSDKDKEIEKLKWNNAAVLKEHLALQSQLSEMAEALDKVVNSDNYDCPMCDSGKLRNPSKEHWDDCAWNNARTLLSTLNKTKEEGDDHEELGMYYNY
jgi:hypothetical protein